MASLNHTVPSPTISDVLTLLCTMKNQNDEAMKEILAKNEEILTKLNSIEEDNRKLRQELLEIKSSLKHKDNGNSLSSRKRNQSENKTEHENEQSNTNKKARVSVASLPQLELGPDSFDYLDDDCLGNVLDFVGKKCYSVFGLVNKRCHEMFCSKGLPKETYLYGYGPLHLIQQRREHRSYQIANGVLHCNRRDIFEWLLTDESEVGCYNLTCLCHDAMKESRLDILREVFDRANVKQLAFLRVCNFVPDLCYIAAKHGKLECMKLLRENECEWDKYTWRKAKREGHEHILQYMRDNGYPTEWQVDSESERESENESESESEDSN